MKIERISENQIRCTLNRNDLSARQLTLRELAYGTDKARVLFREMIQRATAEVGFEADDIPLMIEAIPLSSDGIMLIITKIDDPEELDTRFAKFMPADVDELSIPDGEEELDLSFPSGVGDMLDALNRYVEKQKPESSVRTRCFRFAKLDHVIDAAHALHGLRIGENSLYKAEDGLFYLTVNSAGHPPEDFNRLCNRIVEYGTALRTVNGTELYYEEHYDSIIKGNALESLANI